MIFVNPRGEVLLRLRENKPGLAFAGQWDTIGGALEPGESQEAAAVRETREEIGMERRDHVYWRDYQAVVLLHIYAAHLDASAEGIALSEGERVAWFGLAAALQEDLHPWVAAVLPEFFDSDAFRKARQGNP